MEERKRPTGLYDSAFKGRLKAREPRPTSAVKRANPTPRRILTDLVPDSEVSLEKFDQTATEAEPEQDQVEARVFTIPSFIDRPVAKASRRERRFRLPQLSFKRSALTGMAVVLFLIGLVVSLMALKTNQQINTVHAQNGETVHTDENPDEAEPSSGDISSYQVAPDLPRYVRVPKLNVNSRVLRMGVKQNGQLNAPSNIFDVGWYENSNKPSDPGGAVLLDAHVSGPTRPGAFHNLKQLVAGDTVEVEQGDGRTFTYKVVKSQAYDKDDVDMAAALVSAVPGKAGLNLMTCTGSLQGDDYQQRLIVFAVRD